jgi:hypothetical protein
MEGASAPGSDELADLVSGVVGATKDARALDAGFDAGGRAAAQDPRQAEPAFIGYTSFVVEDTSLVGAGVHAVLTAYAESLVDQDDARFMDVGCVGWADRGARRVGAMLALDHEIPSEMFISLDDVVDVAVPSGEIVS